MRSRSRLIGVVFATTTAVAWGAQFVVGKSALGTVNAFPLTTIRYAIATSLWLIVLVAVEGRSALRLDGRGLRLFWLGTLGFAGFNLLAYTGLAHARPQSASLIVALGPLITALILWRRTRVRPSATTFTLLGVALAGVVLVISGGHPSSIVNGSVGWGDLLVLAGVFSFMLYGLGAAGFPEFSALRYTTLTAGLGWLTIAGGYRGRDRLGTRRRADLGTALVGRAADPVPRDPGSVRRRPDLERRDLAARRDERRALREPDPDHDVRDRDRPRLPAERR